MKTGWQTFETMPPIGAEVFVYSEDGEGRCWAAPCIWTGTVLESRGTIGGCDDTALLWKIMPSLPMEHVVTHARSLAINVPLEI